MRVALLCSVGFLLCSLSAGTQERSAPVPPGLHNAERAGRRPLEPPLPLRRSVDLSQLKREADELAKLAAAIPEQIDHVNQGQIPKDLSDHLKRIEKLAKQLRTEVSP